MVRVGLHQGSALSPFLFNIVFDVITEKVKEEPPWCINYAHDVVLFAENRVRAERKLEEWQNVLDSRRMKISRTKTECFTTDLNGNQYESVQLDGEDLKRVQNLKYLCFVVNLTADTEEEVNYRTQCGWNDGGREGFCSDM